MTFSSQFRESSLMSLRTAKYVEAMTREGDNFDYDTWLKEVREEEAQAKQVKATSGELAAQIAKPIKTSDGQHVRSDPPLRLIPETIRVPKSSRPFRQAKVKTPKAQPRRSLAKVRRAWGEFQSSRRRDAVYGYLEAVFAVVAHHKVRRQTTRLLRQAFKFANLPLNTRLGAFAGVIRCTSGNAVDSKTVSKWARALRYVARFKEPDSRLRTFMKEAGGVNACANLYAKHFGRGK
jgi:hypothetical protein